MSIKSACSGESAVPTDHSQSEVERRSEIGSAFAINECQNKFWEKWMVTVRAPKLSKGLKTTEANRFFVKSRVGLRWRVSRGSDCLRTNEESTVNTHPLARRQQGAAEKAAHESLSSQR